MKLYPSILLIFLIALTGMGLFYWSSSRDKIRSLKAQAWVTHTHETIEHLDEIWILVSRNESAMRGYAITGKQVFVNEYSATSNVIQDHIQRLEDLFADNSIQQNNLKKLQARINTKRAFEKRISAAAAVSPDSAASVISKLTGKKIMEQISDELSVMRTAEDALMNERMIANRGLANNTYKTIVISTCVALLFIIALLLRLNRDILLRRKTQKALQESEAKYREFIENAGMVSFTTDQNGFFTFISNQVAELTGYSAEELTGKHFTELISSSHVEEVAAHYANQGNIRIHSTTLSFPIKHKNGNKKWVEQDTIVLVKNDIHLGFQAVVKDISEKIMMSEKLHQMKVEQREYQQRIQAILDNTPLAIYVKDMAGKYMLVNKKFKDTFNVSDEEIIGKTIHDLKHQQSANQYIDADKKILETGQPIELEDVIQSVEGTRHVLTIKFPLYDNNNKMFGISGFMKDITDMVVFREELIAARQRAENAEMLQEQFLANMSHEIRTPMNGIIGMTNLLQRTNLHQQQQEYVQIIKHSSDNLLVLINDILDLSKIKAGKISIEQIPFNLETSLQSTVATFKLKAEEKNIRFSMLMHPSVPAAIKGDPHRLHQILNNLLSNAMKFTDEGYVTLEVGLAASTEKTAVISFKVSDTGIGIDEKMVRHIFESFTQASNSTTRKYGGTGLGLAITKQLIEMQHGEIFISSKPGTGSVFTVNMPFVISSHQEIQETILPAAKSRIGEIDLSGKRVLIVEDNEINRIVLDSNLKMYNLEVAMAVNGYEAVQYLKNNEAHLVLMDLHMPEMDGFEATEIIRSQLGLNLPIVVLSASALKNEKQRSLELGANDYMSKPFAPDELYDCLLKYLGSGAVAKVEKKSAPAVPTQGFDLSALMQMEDAETILTLYGMFEKLVPEGLEELKAEVAKKDWDKVKFISHKLKSSLGIIQIGNLLKDMSKVEVLSGERRELDSISLMVDDAIVEFNRVIPSIRSEIEKQIA